MRLRKINAWIVRFFEKDGKMMHFRNLLKKTFENFRKFSENFQQIVFVVQTREKLTHGSLNLLKNMIKYWIFTIF